METYTVILKDRDGEQTTASISASSEGQARSEAKKKFSNLTVVSISQNIGESADGTQIYGLMVDDDIGVWKRDLSDIVKLGQKYRAKREHAEINIFTNMVSRENRDPANDIWLGSLDDIESNMHENVDGESVTHIGEGAFRNWRNSVNSDKADRHDARAAGARSRVAARRRLNKPSMDPSDDGNSEDLGIAANASRKAAKYRSKIKEAEEYKVPKAKKNKTPPISILPDEADDIDAIDGTVALNTKRRKKVPSKRVNEQNNKIDAEELKRIFKHASIEYEDAGDEDLSDAFSKLARSLKFASFITPEQLYSAVAEISKYEARGDAARRFNDEIEDVLSRSGFVIEQRVNEISISRNTMNKTKELAYAFGGKSSRQAKRLGRKLSTKRANLHAKGSRTLSGPEDEFDSKKLKGINRKLNNNGKRVQRVASLVKDRPKLLKHFKKGAGVKESASVDIRQAYTEAKEVEAELMDFAQSFSKFTAKTTLGDTVVLSVKAKKDSGKTVDLRAKFSETKQIWSVRVICKDGDRSTINTEAMPSELLSATSNILKRVCEEKQGDENVEEEVAANSISGGGVDTAEDAGPSFVTLRKRGLTQGPFGRN